MLTSTHKKSQMEIIGLVVIVILISLALLFFLQFSLKKGESEKRTFTSAQLTSNMINTIAKTTTNCNGKTISSLYTECISNPFEECNEENICSYANSTITKLLNTTLVEWNKKFRFQVFIPESQGYEQQMIYNNSYKFNLCSGNIQTETYFLPTNSGLLYLRLNICED